MEEATVHIYKLLTLIIYIRTYKIAFQVSTEAGVISFCYKTLKLQTSHF